MVVMVVMGVHSQGEGEGEEDANADVMAMVLAGIIRLIMACLCMPGN